MCTRLQAEIHREEQLYLHSLGFGAYDSLTTILEEKNGILDVDKYSV
jgi:hypothetical protein